MPHPIVFLITGTVAALALLLLLAAYRHKKAMMAVEREFLAASQRDELTRLQHAIRNPECASIILGMKHPLIPAFQTLLRRIAERQI